MLKLKRIYDDSNKTDGFRILVDRLWPRGISKEKAKIDYWLKEIAPTTELRKWYAHDSNKWIEFKKKYKEELDDNKDTVLLLKYLIKKHKTVTLLYSSTDEEHNNAIALKKILKL